MAVSLGLRALAVSYFLSCAVTAGAAETDLELVGQQGANYFFVVSKPWVLDKKYVESVVSNFCAQRAVCAAHVWERGVAMPGGFPLSDKELSTQLASYRSNKNSGLKEMLWRCGAYEGVTPKNCFSD